MRMNCIGAAMAAVSLVSLSTPATAAQIVATIDPVAPPPAAVMLIRQGGTSSPLTLDPGGAGYIGDASLAAPAEWAADYTLVARWTDVNQQLYLRVTTAVGPKITVPVFNRRPTPDRLTLDRIDNLGTDFHSLLEKYFVARDVFRRLQNPKHAIKVRALKLWYDTALLLNRDFPFIGRDEEVIRLAKEAQSRAANDSRFGDLLQLFVKPSYFSSMNEQFLAAEWGEVGLVKKFLDRGDVTTALSINSYFLQKYKTLSPTEQQAIARVQRVDERLLAKNAEYLAVLEAGTKKQP